MTFMSLLVLVAASCGLAAPGSAAGAPAGPPASLARTVGVPLNSGYATARAKLLGAAWKAYPGWGESDVHDRRAYQHPEVLCGQGYHAVCTGRFEKAGEAILVTIDPRSATLRVTSIDRD